jgi:hypothetical protein
MNLRSKQRVYQDVLLSEDFFLVSKYGYRHQSTQIDERNKWKIIFRNEDSERKIEFSFAPFNAKGEEHDLVSIVIYRNPDDFVNLQDYLRYKNIDGFLKVSGTTPDEYYLKLRKNNPFYLINLEGDFKSRLITFIKYIEVLFDTHLKKILEGKHWEEPPIDWGPYK